MGDRTQLERIVELEHRVDELSTLLADRLSSVVLVEKRKPGPAKRAVVKRRKPKPGFKRARKVKEVPIETGDISS